MDDNKEFVEREAANNEDNMDYNIDDDNEFGSLFGGIYFILNILNIIFIVPSMLLNSFSWLLIGYSSFDNKIMYYCLAYAGWSWGIASFVSFISCGVNAYKNFTILSKCIITSISVFIGTFIFLVIFGLIL